MAGITYVQSADVLYLFHPAHPPRKLVRLDTDGDRLDWLLADCDFKDGPYLPLNDLSPNVDTVTPANGAIYSDVYFEVSSYAHTALVTSAGLYTCTLSNDAGNYLVTIAAGHSFVAGNKVVIAGTGTTADGNRTVTATITATTFHIGVAFGSVGVPGTVSSRFATTDGAGGGAYLEFRAGDQWRLARLPSTVIDFDLTATVNVIDNVLLFLDQTTRLRNRTNQPAIVPGSPSNSPTNRSEERRVGKECRL